MRIEDLTVEVRNAALERVGQITAVDLVGFEAVLRFNNVGSWRVSLPIDHPLADAITAPGAGIVVTGPDGVLLSGPMTSVTVDQTDSDPEGTLTIEGTDDSILLAQRLAYPTPTTASVTAQTTAYDKRSGIASTVMRAYVNANIGPAAPAARKITALTLANDPVAGSTVYGSARFDVMGELLTALAAVDGLGFDITQQGASLEFRVYAPQDKSSLVRMDVANDTLASTKFSYSAPGATVAIVGGSGSEEARVFAEVTTTASQAAQTTWARRIETFLDQSSSDDADELNQAGLERLVEDGTTLVSLEVVPSSDLTMAYGVDWNLGDDVAVVVGGDELTATVTSVALRIQADGIYVGATVGKPEGVDYEARLNRRQALTNQRVNALERKEGAPQLVATPQRLYLTKNGVLSTTNNTNAGLQTWTSVVNTGAFTISGNIITFTQGGVYNITVAASFEANTTGNRLLYVTFNGGRTVRVTNPANSTSAQVSTVLVCLTAIPVAANETMTMNVRQTSGGSLNVAADLDTFVSIQSV